MRDDGDSGEAASAVAQDFVLLREYRSQHAHHLGETKDAIKLEQLADRYLSLAKRFTSNCLWLPAAVCNSLAAEVYEKIGALELQCQELINASRNFNKIEWDCLGTNLDLDHSKINTDTVLRKACAACFDHDLSLLAGSICSSACAYRRAAMQDDEGARLLYEYGLGKVLRSANCGISKCCFLKKAVSLNIEQKEYGKAWRYIRLMMELIEAEFGSSGNCSLVQWTLITAVLLEILLFRASVEKDCADVLATDKLPAGFRVLAADLTENLKDPKKSMDKLYSAMYEYLDDTQALLLTAIGELKEENFSDLLLEAAIPKLQ